MKILKKILKILLKGGKYLSKYFNDIPEKCILGEIYKSLKKGEEDKIFIFIVYPVIKLVSLYIMVTFALTIIILLTGNNAIIERTNDWIILFSSSFILSIFYLTIFEIILPIIVLFKRWLLKKFFNIDTIPNRFNIPNRFHAHNVKVSIDGEELDDDELE